MVLIDDEKALQETARRVAPERFLPAFRNRQKAGVQDHAFPAELRALDILNLDLPESPCGVGLNAVTAGLIAEELAFGGLNVFAVNLNAPLNGAILTRHARPEAMNDRKPRMTLGESIVAISLRATA
jgi:cyclohexanecarboxyl-CoA dehydrogenase